MDSIHKSWHKNGTSNDFVIVLADNYINLTNTSERVLLDNIINANLINKCDCAIQMKASVLQLICHYCSTLACHHVL